MKPETKDIGPSSVKVSTYRYKNPLDEGVDVGNPLFGGRDEFAEFATGSFSHLCL